MKANNYFLKMTVFLQSKFFKIIENLNQILFKPACYKFLSKRSNNWTLGENFQHSFYVLLKFHKD